MRRIFPACLSALILTAWLLPAAGRAESGDDPRSPLGLPGVERETELPGAMYSRRSVRTFRDEALSLEDAAAIAWAAQGAGVDGVTGPTRTVPSAGATHPLEIFLSARDVEGLPPGVYRYRFQDHALESVRAGDTGPELARASLRQSFIADAPAVFIIAADPGRTTARYGSRGHQYVSMEAGAASQNIVLQATALGLGSVIVGAFDDGAVEEALGISFEPLLIIPVGRGR